jgi:hypothetical protein
MTFREFNAKYLGPGSLWFMVIGVVCLCQPWVAFLHTWSVLITLIGLIGFNVAAHVPAPVQKIEDDEADATAIGEGRGHV